MTRRKRILLGLCMLVCIKLYFEIGNIIYRKEIKGMSDNQIKSAIEHKTLNMEGYNIHYFLSGDKNKETILFLHPAFSDHTCFNKQIDFFAQQYHVMTIDLLGHGLSKTGK